MSSWVLSALRGRPAAVRSGQASATIAYVQHSSTLSGSSDTSATRCSDASLARMPCHGAAHETTPRQGGSSQEPHTLQPQKTRESGGLAPNPPAQGGL